MDRMGKACEEGAFPNRPYVPPMFVGMVGLVVCDVLVLRGVADIAVAACAALVCLLIGLVLLRSGHVRASHVVIALAAGVFVAGIWSSVALARLDAAVSELASTPVSQCSIVVEGDASESEGSWTVRARVLLPQGGEARVWLTSPESVARGETLRVIGRFAANGDDEWGVSSRSQGIAGRVKAVRIVEREPASGVVGALASLREQMVLTIAPESGDGQALLAGVVAGDRRQLKASGVSDVFSSAGLSHLIAVSGAHLAVVAALVDGVLLVTGVSRGARSGCSLLLSGLFVMACGCPMSALRSWAMLVATTLGRGTGRRGHAPSGLALAGIVMCLSDPFCATDLGFQLSALSVAALSLLSRYVGSVLDALAPPRSYRDMRLVPRSLRPSASKVRRYVRASLVASLTCQMATWALVVTTFGRLSLVAPLASVIVGPLLSPLVLAGLLACLLAFVPLIGDVAMAAAAALSSGVVGIARLLASVPFASIPVVAPPWLLLLSLGMGVLLLVWWPSPSHCLLRRGAAALAVLLVGAFLRLYVLVPPSVIVLDVGQGDAILVRDGPHALLVDTGPSGAIAEALARQHALWLDGIVLSHLHDDHVGGVGDLAGLVPTGSLYVGDGVSGELDGDLGDEARLLVGNGASELRAGDELRLGGFTLACLWPKDATSGSENEDSVCLLLTYGEGEGALKMLLTGDAESDVLAQILDEVGDIDVLKVGHHGSRVSITEGEAASLRAEVAVASAGEGNSYGHPTPECVEVLENSGSWFLCTKDHGDVTVTPGSSGVGVTLER